MEASVEADSRVDEVAPQQDTEVHDDVSQEQAQVATAVEEDKQAANFKAMREKQRELERQLRMQTEMSERLMQMVSQSAPKQAPEPDELDAIADDDFMTKGKTQRLVRKDAREVARDVVKEEFRKQQQEQFMVRLKSQFSDFDDVVNPETLSLLEQKDPELAQAIGDTKDPYKIGLQSYKYIKALGLVEKAPQEKRAKEVEKKIAANAKTVQSPTSYDKRPMAQAFKFGEAEKKALYEEMMGYASQSGFSY